MGAQIPNNPGMAILSLGIESIPPPLRKIVSHILLGVRLEIARHWKQKGVPTFTEVIRTTNLHISYEIMFAIAQNNTQSLHTTWKPWLDWYNVNKV